MRPMTGPPPIWPKALAWPFIDSEDMADDDRQAATVDIGDDAGRNLEEQAGDLDDRAEQDELERPEADDPYVVDGDDRVDHADEERGEQAQKQEDPEGIQRAVPRCRSVAGYWKWLRVRP